MYKQKIGFIGQGFIGKNYADNFEKRGFDVVRYSKDKFAENKEKIQECRFVFLCVPAPTTFKGFDTSILEEVLTLVAPGSIAIIKSTVLPGITDTLQAKFPNIFLLHSPEFLTEATAEYDANHPDRNIVGYTAKSKCVADEVMKILEVAPYSVIVPAKEAEFIKYGGNCWFYLKVVYINMLYDLAQKLGIDYEIIKEGMQADKRIGNTHLDPIHKGGRGAGGHCFIKDMAAFAMLYEIHLPTDFFGNGLLSYLQDKNYELLEDSAKDVDLLRNVYVL
ncbi:MAG: NAD(P)-binding domain-containing protein [bacterium]